MERVSVWSNRIQRDGLKPGDHIYYWAPSKTFAHHGIYTGNDHVIHYTRAGHAFISSANVSNDQSMNGRVIVSSVDEFLGRKKLYLYAYGVSSGFFKAKRGGTCTIDNSHPPQDVIHRATYLLQHGFGRYDLFRNNCEDFALYCKTGRVDPRVGIGGGSGQVRANATAAAAGAVGGVFTTFSTIVAIGATAGLSEFAAVSAAVGASGAAAIMLPVAVAVGFCMMPVIGIAAVVVNCAEARYKLECERIETSIVVAVEDLAAFRS